LGENEIDTSENPYVKPSDKTPTSYQDVKDKFNKNLRSSNKLQDKQSQLLVSKTEAFKNLKKNISSSSAKSLAKSSAQSSAQTSSQSQLSTQVTANSYEIDETEDFALNDDQITAKNIMADMLKNSTKRSISKKRVQKR
jgi:hypothetical protein